MDKLSEALQRRELMEFMNKWKLNKAEMARCLGVTEGAVYHWLDGRRAVPSLVLMVIRYFDSTETNIRGLVDD